MTARASVELRLLHFQNDVGLLEDALFVGRDLGSGFPVRVVVVVGAFTGVVLDHNPRTLGDVLRHRLRDSRHAVLVFHDFSRDSQCKPIECHYRFLSSSAQEKSPPRSGSKRRMFLPRPVTRLPWSWWVPSCAEVEAQSSGQSEYSTINRLLLLEPSWIGPFGQHTSARAVTGFVSGPSLLFLGIGSP